MLRPLFFLRDSIARLYQHFDTLPKGVELENSRFYTVSNLAQTLAWNAHMWWFFVFWYLEIYTLAWVQLLSVLAYVIAIVANRKGHHMTSMTISLMEIILHQILAVWLLGAMSGFQYFIPVVAIFPFLKPSGSVFLKTGLLLMCAAAFLFIELYVSTKTPIYNIGDSPLMIFNITNIVMAFGFVGLWALYLNVAIYRAEIILAKRTREVALLEQKAEQDKLAYDLQVKERDNEIFRLRNIELEEEKNKSRKLLLNILPEETADELMNSGKARPRRYDSATVLFADFVGFTSKAEQMEPEELIRQIDVYFSAFDRIAQKHSIEKIKTIGDAYMAVGGLPVANRTHPFDAVKAAMEMLAFAEKQKSLAKIPFEIRIGIHTGSLVAGVVGEHKFQYDIWGDTVNVAARMEQNSSPGKINISAALYNLVKNEFLCSSRGPVEVKNKGKIEMYFLESGFTAEQ